MIKVLKRKFVLATMIVVTILLICMMAIINIINAVSFNSYATALVKEIARGYETSPDIMDSVTAGSQGISADTQTPGEENPGGSGSLGAEGGSEEDSVFSRNVNEENGFSIEGKHDSIFSFMLPDINYSDVLGAIYFTVTLDPSGKPIDTDVSRVVNPTAEYAANMAISMHQERKSDGWLEKCVFTTLEDEQGNIMYIFLHRDRDVENQMRVLIVSILVSLIFFFAILILCLIMAGKMLRPVVENIEKQKNFITNASHEIKTPLAIIQANAEALELYNGENKWTGNIREQVSRLSVLLTNMLTLARADEGTVRFDVTDVDVSQLLNELLEMFHEAADQRSLTLFKSIEEGLVMRVNRIQIIQFFSILIDNAVKYSLEGSRVEFYLSSKERAIVLETSNRCESLPDCDPEQLFERFYRPESSRYSSNNGNGIGLSAARAIIESYGGSLTCKYEGKDTIQFTMIFRK